MPDPTDRQRTLILALKDVLQAAPSLALRKVYYGIQTIIPETPSVGLEGQVWTRELTSTGLRTTNRFQVGAVLYFASLDDPEIRREECDELTEKIIDVLDANRTLGGLVANGYVTSVEPGFAAVPGHVHLMMGSRLIWEAISKVDRVR